MLKCDRRTTDQMQVLQPCRSFRILHSICNSSEEKFMQACVCTVHMRSRYLCLLQGESPESIFVMLRPAPSQPHGFLSSSGHSVTQARSDKPLSLAMHGELRKLQ